MATPDNNRQALILAAEQQERRARQNAVWYAVLPILLAAALMAFTGLQITQLTGVQSELTTTQNELKSTYDQLAESEQMIADSEMVLNALRSDLEQTRQEYQTATEELQITATELELTQRTLEEVQQSAGTLQVQVDQLERELQNLTAQFQQTRNFGQFEVVIETGAGVPDELSAAQARVFIDVLDQQRRDVRFNPTGASVEVGFNSPNFAVAVLERYGLLPPGYDFDMTPWEQFPQVRAPENGDLVYYESGYTMFYFSAPEEFVIGMTPEGIQTLRPDFAPILGFLDVAYP